MQQKVNPEGVANLKLDTSTAQEVVIPDVNPELGSKIVIPDEVCHTPQTSERVNPLRTKGPIGKKDDRPKGFETKKTQSSLSPRKPKPLQQKQQTHRVQFA